MAGTPLSFDDWLNQNPSQTTEQSNTSSTKGPLDFESWQKKQQQEAESKKTIKEKAADLFKNRPSEKLNLGKIAKAGLESAEVPAGVATSAAILSGGALLPEAATIGIPATIGMGLAGMAGELSRQLGASPATQFGTEVVAGGPGGEALAKAGTRGVKQLGETFMGTLQGDLPKTFKGLKGLFVESPEEIAKRTTAEQAKQFGKPTPNFLEGKTTGEFSTKAQESLKQQHGIAANSTEPVSATLRTKLNSEVTNIATKGRVTDRFSSSPEAKDFLSKLDILNKSKPGSFSKADIKNLEDTIKLDVNANSKVRSNFASGIDDAIRQWQGDLSKSGAKAIDERTAQAVRENLRDSYNTWLESKGLGRLESDYRSAYRTESKAKALDSIPEIVSKYGTEANATKLAEQLGKDLPQATPILTKQLETHFANIPAENIVSEFERLDKLLVKSGALSPQELTAIREQVNMVKKAQAGVPTEALTKRILRGVVNGLSRATATESIDTVREKFNI